MSPLSVQSNSEVAAAVVFWLAVGLIAYVYVGYPAFIAFLNLFRRPQRAEPDNYPSISVLIAAYNEEAGIGEKLEKTLALDYPKDKLEVIVLSDCSSDRTDEIVQSFTDPRIRLLRMKERKGKTHAQNEGVKACTGEVLVFSDATTNYHPMSLRYLASNYRDSSVGAVSGRYEYFDPDGTSPTGMGSRLFWNYENLIKLWQSRLRTISGCCGCIYSVRREAYTDLPADVISDLVQPLWVISKGYRVVFEDRALAYEHTTRSSEEEFSMRVRVVTRGIRGILSVSQLLNPFRWGWVSFQLLSHKVLRWLIPVFMLLALVSSGLLVSYPLYRYLFIAQAAFYLVALLSIFVPMHKNVKVLGIPLYFCTLNAAAFLSLIEVARGRKYVVWQTVRK